MMDDGDDVFLTCWMMLSLLRAVVVLCALQELSFDSWVRDEVGRLDCRRQP